MRRGIPAWHVLCAASWLAVSASAAEGFRTTTFGNAERCELRETLRADADSVRFDLSSLPPDAKVWRAVLRVSAAGHTHGAPVRLAPAGLTDTKALRLRPPLYDCFDATECVKSWVAKPETNAGLKIEQSGGLRFGDAVLEVSLAGAVPEPAPPVSGLQAFHQCGQTFLTWREIEDPVADDAPRFEDFERRVLDRRQQREIVYRVYRHAEPITLGNLGAAELLHEIPAVLSAWNLLEIEVTEHPNQGTPTKNSVLRPGYNLALRHPMHRYRITAGGEPIPRGTALAVVTARAAAAHYYAVTAAVNGREAVRALGAGASLERPIQEKPNDYPAIIWQRTNSLGSAHPDAPEVDIYNSWLEPPYHNVPLCSETYIVRWTSRLGRRPDPVGAEPQPTKDSRVPLRVEHGTYGGTATELGSPGWHGARNYVPGAFTIGLSQGGLWQGFHECIGTLQAYDDGVVHNYPQRRVLAATHWAIAQPDFGIDPERVCLTAQFAHWGLRYGDLFAVVASNAHANFAIGRIPQQHGWKWGPYPAGSKNWLGIDQWEYMDLPKWIREHPTVELPYWLCHPAYGAYPAHTVGDFGFMPWPEMIQAMVSTKRAFAATWSSNGPGLVGPLYALVPRIRLHQSLPAFTNCSLDHSIGDGDHDDAQKGGGMNLYQLWEPETIVDEANRWEITLELRSDCPADSLTTNLTPRRTQRFKAQPGEVFCWTRSSLASGRELQSGHTAADAHGFVTMERLTVTAEKCRVKVERRRSSVLP